MNPNARENTSTSAEKPALDERELFMRRRAVANAIATQRLEGREVDPETLADLERIAQGKMEVDEAIRRGRERIAAGYYRDRNPPASIDTVEHVADGVAR